MYLNSGLGSDITYRLKRSFGRAGLWCITTIGKALKNCMRLKETINLTETDDLDEGRS